MGQKFHINKHGVPAPCKATKGNCPLGGASGNENHFDNAQDAQEFANQDNERQHGLLPSMKTEVSRDNMNSRASEVFAEIRNLEGQGSTKGLAELKKEIKTLESDFAKAPLETWEETRTIIYDGHGNPLSPSNLVSSISGHEEKVEHFEGKIKEAGFDSEKLAKTLSEDQYIRGNWEVKSEAEDKILLESVTASGNVRNLTVSKESLEEKVTPKGSTKLYNAYGMTTSLLNHVKRSAYNDVGAREHFDNIIKSSKMNPNTIINKLNNDESVRGEWSVESEDLKKIKLKTSDSFNNVDYVEISKGV